MKFNYSGRNRAGEFVRGSVEATDEVEARVRLRAMQVRPESLKGGAGAPGLLGMFKKADGGSKDDRRKPKGPLDIKINLALGPPIKLKGLIIFTRQFSSLVDSGVAIVQCLDILMKQEKKPAFRNILRRIKEDIESGSGLAEAMGKHPKAFSEFFIRVVEAGEISGTLDKALKRVGMQLEKLGRIKSKVIGAMLYPCITVVIAVVVLIFLLVKVIPEIAKLYSASKAKLPELTTAVLALSQWFQDNYVYVIGGFIGSIVGASMAYKVKTFRRYFDPFWLHVPLFGALTKKAAIALFTRTLATLIQSGVPLLNAFEICQKLIGNLAIKDTIGRASASVTEGKSIAQGLSESSIFPPMVIHMVSIGEMTGRLDELMAKVADIFDDEVDEAINTLTGLIQPALIVVVGILIAILLLAMYLPIFQLADKTSGA